MLCSCTAQTEGDMWYVYVCSLYPYVLKNRLFPGSRQLGNCQIRHRLKEQTRHLLNSAPVKFGTYILPNRTQYMQIGHRMYSHDGYDPVLFRQLLFDFSIIKIHLKYVKSTDKLLRYVECRMKVLFEQQNILSYVYIVYIVFIYVKLSRAHLILYFFIYVILV